MYGVACRAACQVAFRYQKREVISLFSGSRFAGQVSHIHVYFVIVLVSQASGEASRQDKGSSH